MHLLSFDGECACRKPREIGLCSERCAHPVLLAISGVVVVSFNYQLGEFGFFTYPGLDSEAVHHASGNY